MSIPAIRAEVEIPRPPETVWQVLTESRFVYQWLMTNDITTEVGKEFTLRMPEQSNFDGIIRCKVLKSQEPQLFSYSWVSPDLDTVLNWQLIPTASGTLLKLEHSGFDLGKPEQISRYKAFNVGWSKVLKDLFLPVVESLS